MITSTELGADLTGPWTAAEREVWRILEQGLLGYTFRRNVVLNGTLVGFYCPELGLVLELIDGSAAVSQREAALSALNLKVARLPGTEVSRSNLVEAIEVAVGRGRMWPED